MPKNIKIPTNTLYDANHNQDLITARDNCKQLCYEYNSTPYTQTAARRKILRKIIGKMGKNCTIEPAFFCDYGFNIHIEDNVYINHNSVFLDAAPIHLGKNVFIGPNCGFYTASHPLDYKERAKGLETAKPITIGKNVWIGGNVCVLSGVKIGDNTVIGAGSVVVKDIPANCVAVGNPCHVIKKLKK